MSFDILDLASLPTSESAVMDTVIRLIIVAAYRTLQRSGHTTSQVYSTMSF